MDKERIEAIRQGVISVMGGSLRDLGEKLNASGDPNLKSVEEAVGFDITVAELDSAYEEYLQRVEVFKRLKAIRNGVASVMVARNSKDININGYPDLMAVEKVVEFDVMPIELDQAYAEVRLMRDLAESRNWSRIQSLKVREMEMERELVAS